MADHGPHCHTCTCGCTCGYGGQHDPNNPHCYLNEIPEEEVFGKFAETVEEGHQPGVWDEVRDAFIQGHLSEHAYEVLHRLVRGDRP